MKRLLLFLALIPTLALAQDYTLGGPNAVIKGDGSQLTGLTAAQLPTHNQNQNTITNATWLTAISGTYASNTSPTSVNYDISLPRQFTNCGAATITFTGLTGVTTANQEMESSLTLRNTNAGSVTLNLPANWFTQDGAHTYVITNGHHGELSVKVWVGNCTNAGFRDLRIAP